jgi:dTDP-4-dehydrorhamnose 3,5-epimerase
MQVDSTAIPDVKVITPKVFGDDRGFFMESWNAKAFAEAGIDATFVQDNHSKSAKDVLRGLHYQIGPTQGKLVRVVAGSVFDVAVDMRRSSPTFGKWVGETLSATNRKMLWVPEGFAHGFLSLENGTEFLYKCTALYTPAVEHCLVWNDPDLGIDWPIDGMAPLVSAKDAVGKTLSEAATFA